VMGQNSVIASAEITDEKGRLLSKAHKTKPLSDKDAVAKAETGALGRALSFFGIGTELAVQDLEEGDEIVDKAIKKEIPTASNELKQPKIMTPAEKALTDTINGIPNYFKSPNVTPTQNQQQGLKKASPAQIKRLWAVAKEKNLSNNDVFRMMNIKYGLTKVEDLDWKQYKEFVDGDLQNIDSLNEEINSQPPPPTMMPMDEIPF